MHSRTENRSQEDETHRVAARGQALTLRSQMDETQAERTAAERLLTSLEEVNRQHAYYSDAVRQVLSPEHASSVNAMGTLADFVEVDQQYERLVESLFGRELQEVRRERREGKGTT